VYAGETIECLCEFDEGSDQLDALFWSINGTRFYRYEPTGGPSSQYSVINDDQTAPLVDNKILQVVRKFWNYCLLLN